MLVYGDRSRTIDPRRALTHIAELLAGQSSDRFRNALIAAGQLAQGLADAEFLANGCDDLSDRQDAAMALTIAVAGRLLGRSAGDPDAPLTDLRGMRLPVSIRSKTPEGYAYYAVYPEAYAVAAAAHRWSAPPLVLGLRSIGTSLAGAVAAVTGGQALSLRPTGPPFRRCVHASDRLKMRLAAHRGPFAIVDEGPGLSGSSLGCAADLLEDLGVASDRIVFMPSHGGDLGPEAAPRHRARWVSARRLVGTLDDLTARDPLSAWFEADVGRADRAEDISAGAWRAGWIDGAKPPALPMLERRKMRICNPSGAYVARFAGLGEFGEAKLERAQVLHDAGFGPEPIALRRGFLLERWVDAPLVEFGRRRTQFVARLGDYLDLRRRCFPATDEDGAGPSALSEMTLVNAASLGGAAVADGLERLLRRLDQTALRAVYVDGRLHPWEWRRPAGGLCKLDAIDHACGHDLVGAQDILWDVAGAVVEFGLTTAEEAQLVRRLSVDGACVRPMTACYAAFQGGLWSMAGAAGPGDDRALETRRALYRDRLRQLAAHPS
jgi:hypothetical protein